MLPAVNVTDAAAFVVSITRNESVEIKVTDEGKVNVRVNGVDSVRGTDAADVTSLTITANGNFANRIDLRGLDPASFIQLGDVRVNGGTGNDLIIGSSFNDDISGGSGNDTLLGLDGNDTLAGGNGNDVLIGGSEDDSLTGDSGNDTLSGEADSDTCLGGSGADKISGGDGNDNVNGQAGNDSVSGDAGDDYVFGGAGRDTLFGGDGDDVDIVRGQAGRDVIQGSLAATQSAADAFDARYGILRKKPIGLDASSEYNESFDFDTSFIPAADDFLALV